MMLLAGAKVYSYSTNFDIFLGYLVFSYTIWEKLCMIVTNEKYYVDKYSIAWLCDLINLIKHIACPKILSWDS